MTPSFIHRGSVKDIYKLTDSILIFSFSDRYSIFDWGTMPDEIPMKGISLARMGIQFFRELHEMGISTHFIEMDRLLPSQFAVKKIEVPRDGMDIYRLKPSRTLIPLEVIFRLGVPKGSSLLKRFKSEQDWKDAGYDRKYAEGEMFPEIHIDFTTKLETLDRVLSPEEAKQLSGMEDSEWIILKERVLQIASHLRKRFAECEIQLWDGKFEFAFGENREVVLVDSIGIDELRLTYKGKPLSKEILRQFYIDSDWYRNLNLAKQKDTKKFREICKNEFKSFPERLDPKAVDAVSKLYQSVAEILNPASQKKKILQEMDRCYSVLEELA